MAERNDELDLDEVPEEQIFNVTFGMRYRREDHDRGWHPDGWVTIVADSYEEARVIAWEECAPWGFIYDHLDRESNRVFDPKYHPQGSLAIFDGRKK